MDAGEAVPLQAEAGSKQPLSGAERSRRHRARRRGGRFVLGIEVSDRLIDRLVARRLVPDAETYDLELLARRLALVLDDLSRGR